MVLRIWGAEQKNAPMVAILQLENADKFILLREESVKRFFFGFVVLTAMFLMVGLRGGRPFPWGGGGGGPPGRIPSGGGGGR